VFYAEDRQRIGASSKEDAEKIAKIFAIIGKCVGERQGWASAHGSWVPSGHRLVRANGPTDSGCLGLLSDELGLLPGCTDRDEVIRWVWINAWFSVEFRTALVDKLLQPLLHWRAAETYEQAMVRIVTSAVSPESERDSNSNDLSGQRQ
jgi:hypothetical protein